MYLFAGCVMDEKGIAYNADYETLEYVHPDGYIEVFRDDCEARLFAEENNLIFNSD
jgi:hypothetical protein